ncbi:MSHA biogenesis protein MshM [Natronospira proteinivora]|uniref:MSHA biogenesis protein MshM n=1 Tax=Natronospira proteinivora TaxID=1807133 RepID=A0ABT1G9X6_9GAMM|nr:AAA family ATPase [Natronospira proteinivora]MCP1728094.1 MSHA biogenesis protein MshM [Natronospira proteinivora]
MSLYLSHFGLKEFPFSLTPDTGFYYDSRPHQEALNVLLVALRSGEGFLKVTGEVGLGKTLLCRMLLDALKEEAVTAYIPNPHLSPASMRLSLARELGLNPDQDLSQEQLLQVIQDRLMALAGEEKPVVLVLDEAQQLPEATLEAVRLLTNLETEKRKLIQVVLFGQPELEERLARPSVRQLRQRITFSYRLLPLDRDTVEDYVRHRLRVAGYRGAPLFTRPARRALFRRSEGTPRLVNVLAHKALMAAWGEGSDQVEGRHVRRAADDTEGVGLAAWGSACLNWRTALGLVLLIGVAGGLIAWGLWPDFVEVAP